MKKRLILLELALVCFIAGWFCTHRLGFYSFGFGDFDQTLHAKVVQEMVHQGNYLVPTLDGRPYNNKPPFKMWLTAGVVKLLGESTLSYRVLDGIVGTLFFVVFFLYVRYRVPGVSASWFAFAALLACPQLFQAHGLRDGTQDGMLNLLMMGTLICADFAGEAILCGRRRRALVLSVLGGLFLGLALLTKSIGAVIVIPVITSLLLLRGELLAVVKRGWLSLCAGVTAAMVLPAIYWVIRISLQQRNVWRIVWRTEVVHRIVKGYQNKDRPLFYFNLIFDYASAVPPVILVLSLAWGAYRFLYRHDKRLALPLSWAIIPVVCYSFVKSRLPWYIQFSYPGMAMLVGLAATASIVSAKQVVFGYREKDYRRVRTALIGISFLCISVYQLCGTIRQTASHIAKPHRILEVERIVRMLQPGLSYTEGRGKVYSTVPKKRSLREERFYWAMLGSKPIRAAKLSHVVGNPDLRMLIIELEQLSQVARIRRPLGFTLVEPYKKRTNWNVVLYFNEQDLVKVPAQDLVRTEELHECRSGLGLGFSGLSKPVPVGDNYGCVIEKDTATHPINARGGTGVNLKYEVSLAGGSSPVVVQAFIGQHPLGKASVESGELQTIEFSVPPGGVPRKARAVTLRLTREAGSNLYSANSSLVVYRIRSSTLF